MDDVIRLHARRVFEESLRSAQGTYGPPPEELTVACMIDAPGGEQVCIARYTLYPDGRIVRVVDDA